MKWTKLWVFLLSFALILPASAQSLQDLFRISGGKSNNKQKIAVLGAVLYHINKSQSQRHNRRAKLPEFPGQQQRSPVYIPPQAPPSRPSPASNPGYRPSGYTALEVGGKPARLEQSLMPLTINPGHPSYHDIVDQAIQPWNAAGVGQLFAVTQGQADLTLDWSGARVSPGARAETRMMTSSRQVVPVELSIRTQGRNGQQLTRILTHELGHVLGLDHSNNSRDVMYRSEQNLPVGLSDRDLQMVQWLYSQESYTPIVGQTSRASSIYARNLWADPEVTEAVCNLHDH